MFFVFDFVCFFLFVTSFTYCEQIAGPILNGNETLPFQWSFDFQSLYGASYQLDLSFDSINFDTDNESIEFIGDTPYIKLTKSSLLSSLPPYFRLNAPNITYSLRSQRSAGQVFTLSYNLSPPGGSYVQLFNEPSSGIGSDAAPGTNRKMWWFNFAAVVAIDFAQNGSESDHFFAVNHDGNFEWYALHVFKMVNIGK